MSDENDIQSCKRLLNEISEMCEHASLTGSLSGGSRRTAQRYNSILARLTEFAVVPTGLFSALPEEADYGEIGVESRMLASYFPSNKDKHRHRDDADRNIVVRLAPFVGKEELALLIHDQAQKGMGLDMNTLSSIAPFLGQDALGKLLRDHLSKERSSPDQATAPTPPAPPEPPRPSPQPAATGDLTLKTVEPSSDRIEDLLDLLKSPYLSDEERSDAVERLRAATHPSL